MSGRSGRRACQRSTFRSDIKQPPHHETRLRRLMIPAERDRLSRSTLARRRCVGDGEDVVGGNVYVRLMQSSLCCHFSHQLTLLYRAAGPESKYAAIAHYQVLTQMLIKLHPRAPPRAFVGPRLVRRLRYADFRLLLQGHFNGRTRPATPYSQLG